MHPDIQLKLENCQKLPTIPAVVIQILQVCQKEDFCIDELAKVIRNDPALSVKLLKIVNSPIFGISRKITTVSNALVWLGVNAVRTIALSLSMVSSMGNNGTSFNYDVYWKRSLLSALVARTTAEHAGYRNKEEVFLAALLQDIGILAMNEGLGEPYIDLARQADTDHMRLLDLERRVFGTDHAEVGGWLAERWHLPPSIAEVISNSHGAQRNNGALGQASTWVRVSGWIADIWLTEDATAATSRARVLTHELLSMSKEEFEDILDTVAEAIPQMSALFDVNLGSPNAVQSSLEEAREAMMLLSLQSMLSMESRTREIEENSYKDALTGLFNRKRMEPFLREAYQDAEQNNKPISVMFCDIDHFKSVNDTYGHQAGDQVLEQVAYAVKDMTLEGCLAVRYGGEEFVVIMPNIHSKDAHRIGEEIRKKVKAQHHHLSDGRSLQVTISIGCATHNDQIQFKSAKGLVAAADKALYVAKDNGRDRVEVFEDLRLKDLQLQTPEYRPNA